MTEREVLQEVSGVVPGLVIEPRTLGVMKDALVRFGDRSVELAIEVKSRVNVTTAWALVAQLRGHRMATLVVAGDTTSESRRILEQQGISFVDTVGNSHISLPGIFVHTSARGQRKQNPSPPDGLPKLRGKAGVVTQALLLDPKREWHLNQLAETAGVSPAFAYRVVTRLELDGALSTLGAIPNRVRKVTDPSMLLDLWASEQRRPKRRVAGYFPTSTGTGMALELGRRLGAAGAQYALTGASGSLLIAPFASSVPVASVWLGPEENIPSILRETGTIATGEVVNVVFFQSNTHDGLAFSRTIDGVCVANIIRLYGDLKLDPQRGEEQAAYLRERVIGF